MGSIRRLAMVQRQALLVMTGVLRSTATDILEAHANILPFDLLVHKHCHRAAVRLCALPSGHPLAVHVQRVGPWLVQSHRSSLHELLDAYRPFLDYKHTERILPARHHQTATLGTHHRGSRRSSRGRRALGQGQCLPGLHRWPGLQGRSWRGGRTLRTGSPAPKDAPSSPWSIAAAHGL